MPSKVLVELTLEEAIWIATVAGRQRGESPHSQLYGVLTADVFNRYWDDGLEDARKEFPVTVPPIRYED